MTKFYRSEAVRRSKSKRGQRHMLHREPKIVENAKNTLMLKGHATSETISSVLSDLHVLKKPLCRKLQRKNDILPFEAGGEAHLENLASLNDCSLFALGNHTKKRPNNLVLGRTFDGRLLDMVEFGVENYKSIAEMGQVNSSVDSKPLLLFNGEADDFEGTETSRKLKNLLLDWFRGPRIEKLNLNGVDRVIVFTLKMTGIILLRHYSIAMKRSSEDGAMPSVELAEAGPSMDLRIKRSQFASEELMRVALKQAKLSPTETKKKNISKSVMGDKLGRVHLGRQDLSGMALARMKGLGKKRRGDALEKGNRGEEAEGDVSAGTAAKRRKTEDK